MKEIISDFLPAGASKIQDCTRMIGTVRPEHKIRMRELGNGEYNQNLLIFLCFNAFSSDRRGRNG